MAAEDHLSALCAIKAGDFGTRDLGPQYGSNGMADIRKVRI
jgi:hypothetical protein